MNALSTNVLGERGDALFVAADHLQYAMAGVVFEYNGSGIFAEALRDGARSKHMVRNRPPDVRVQIIHDEPKPLVGQVLYTDLLWRLVRSDGWEQIVFAWPDVNAEPVMCATRHARDNAWTYFFGQAAERYLHQKNIRHHYILPGGLVFEMVVVMQQLLQRGGLVFHASAVRLGGDALIFAGVSGRGKTTISNLWTESGYPVLAEESIAVLPCSGAWQCSGLPWGSRKEVADATPARLRAIYLLRHDAQNVATPLTRARAFEAMMQVAFLPYWDRAELEKALACLESLASQVEVFDLGFAPDARVVSMLKGAENEK